MRRSQDGSVPVGHEQVLSVFQAVAAGFSSETLFALFELLQQAEVARDLGRHGSCSMFPFFFFLSLSFRVVACVMLCCSSLRGAVTTR